MRPLIFFILLFSWVSACAPVSKKHRKRYRNTYPAQKSVKKQKRFTKPYKQKPPSTPSLNDVVRPSLLPTILNEHDQALMILIKKGRYKVRKKELPNSGTLKKNQPAARLTNLAAFYIDRTETTVAQFRKYQPDYDEKPFTGGKACSKCPAMGINWIQASTYCRWAGKRLPREEEWEAAARGITNYSYPWGDTFIPLRSNLLGEDDGYLFAAPVGSFNTGASTSGIMDMAGNVWEWVDSKKSEQPIPDTRLVKGGGWTSGKKQAKISFRNHVDLKMNNPTFGFRCAKSLRHKPQKKGNRAEGQEK